ncbi:hypothetical protein COW36_22275 [bacterium (Candidatus Blackallbacteria) CG17_big_fil_post_rev_8_21_14_2_50_48_46]|uniref:GAF domain-containing protein n=1 Tax=bacterium (Candidatus Blackallbacteria) CG17_big_fil_post_rev_8_21_14_2_50_48_46 TaxID=2014261 RepID=A0A2M7FYL3_9BACT|nr:MAG: hypothetical protein COW64_13705 [bacterium (Candidatus Blackallbacteria) CG18_big_fil_WC_8_21_14_2_50_49_26]PIW14342.1 MAG: hypothetical protein COW36_22275 [bacterium (Candidatus Blackallbacteria) CG17_big_fil_post_rev_8_21_14_2_50_48_46]PIW45611.1 MAG: hypothetical protein COW20_19880 [bacterium (Candidatus Blackallbacteria) CG13_big_fil_rev_8_21_14_2_50_49_14]
MQNPNLPPGAQPVQGQPPQKLTRDQKRALAEQKKRMEQERMRSMELQKLVGNFQSELETSVIDPPLMLKLACNRFKLMLKADHCVATAYETYPEHGGEICLIRQQSNLPPKPEKKDEGPQVKRVVVGTEIMEVKIKQEKTEDDAPKIPMPVPPPKEPLKGGQLPDLEGVFMHPLAIMEQVRSSRQFLMIPDCSKYSDQGVVQFAAPYGIKSMLLLPVIVKGEVMSILIVMTTNQPQGYMPLELRYIQQALDILVRSIETAPPILPEKLKERVINPMTHGDNVPKQIDYYSEYFDNIFDFMIAELEEDEAEELIEMQKEQEHAPNKLRKVWLQIGKFLELKDKPKLAYLFNIAMNELAEQAIEYAEAKKFNQPRGLKAFQEFMDRQIKKPDIKGFFMENDSTEKQSKMMVVGNDIISMDTDAGAEAAIIEEMLEEVDKEVSKAVRGALLFNDNKRATLINDIEQSEMLVNFVAITAANDFCTHIKAALPEMHEDIEQTDLVSELAHQGMREISLVVAQNMAEKYLYEMEDFLEQPEEIQKEQISQLQMYIHYRIMANLVPTLRAEEPSLWALMIQDKIKKKAQKAAKQRAVLVGRMVRASSSESDEDWDEGDEEEDEDEE